MEKRWREKESINEDLVEKLSSSLNNLNLNLSQILVERGVDSFEKAKSFFRPSLQEVHDPFLMKDMDVAVDRLQKAIESGERILIYGDYDVDGTCSVALVYSFLQNFHDQLDYYIPDRYKEGYGISFQGIDYAHDNEISLIIALDCGIKANKKVEYANEKEIDFIICDHHLPGEELPSAHAILDPKRSDCGYPFKELSGCGVGYKLMQAYCEREGIAIEKLYDKLDILAVSICADIVPIIGENRIFTHFGLQKLNDDPQPGFRAMLETAVVKKKQLSVTDVVFTLAPRINAAGRIESGKKAVEVMISENAELAKEGSFLINENNSDRKTLDKSITKEALAMIESNKELQNRKTTVLFDSNWHKGVIGIVASRCIENYYRPTIILTESDGKISGSARSVIGYNVYDALEQCSSLLEQFGGHKYAAGMTLKKENIKAFQNRFEEVVSNTISDDLLIPEIQIDTKLELKDINAKFYKLLKQFAPFGPSNRRPVFLSSHVFDKGNARIVGDNHLKLDLVESKGATQAYPAIAFGLGEHLGHIKSGGGFDAVYTLEENEWNGRTTIQLNVKDIKSIVD